MKRFTLLAWALLALATSACSGSPQERPVVQTPISESTVCSQTEQSGCLEIDLVVYKNKVDNETIVSLVSGKRESGDGAAAELYRASKRGEVSIDNTCYKARLFFWGVSSQISKKQMREYFFSGNTLMDRAVKGVPVSDQSPLLGGKRPEAAFETEVCGRYGFQVPYEFLGPDTTALFCLDADLLYPRKREGESGEGLVIHNSIQSAVSRKDEFIILAMIADRT